MKPSDIIITGSDGKKYKRIKNALGGSKNGGPRLSERDFQLLVALFGLNHGTTDVDISGESSEEVDKAEISRTSYSRDEMNFDVAFGLITIIKNYQDDYHKIVDKVAFQKNGDGKDSVNYRDLPNVSAFYDALRDGISPFYDMLNTVGSLQPDDVYKSINRYIDRTRKDLAL